MLAGCYDFVWQGFGSGGTIGVASVKSCKKFPPCLIKSQLAGSKMDSLLHKAKPISDSGSTSVITYLRKGRKKSRQEKWQCRERSETF